MERHFKAKPKYTCWSYGSLTSVMVSMMCDEAEKSPMSHRYLHTQNSTCTIQKRRPCREHRCGADQVPSEGQIRTSYNSRVLERGELCIHWLMRVLGLL